MKNIIYFTKENGQNIILLTAKSNDISMIGPTERNLKLYKKILGHKPINVYVLIDGKEFKFPEAWLRPDFQWN
ncbi:hypothetical protein [Lactobacillus johnsonii]|uniref:hypothetical protein n=1 Tax=Lactobacillus johnsonii TaxID=33959 RepID=UPI0022E4AF0E|nr:hypothetical protein [Lactobacillus johnsonii]